MGKLTQLCTFPTVNIEGLIAFVYFSEAWVEHKTIRAETFFGDSISALVILVALYLVFVLSIFVIGALEFLGI